MFVGFAPIYIVQRAFFRAYLFFVHWHRDGLRFVAHHTLSFLERLDQTFAFMITLRHLFEPLYQDYSVIGYILGFIFRVSRLFIGGVIYGGVLLFAGMFYLAWAVIPFAIVSVILYESGLFT